eukprot:GHRR01010186.1.p1 GENE.GHRR01010186.1~~GHRR01010186.1.p1  ORF type:complete len:185 (+),score=88.23 GHRR01010186.1:870-1424(+)
MATEAAARPSMSTEDWNNEAADTVEEIIKTQKEVAALLAKHSSATSELEAMKEDCAQELEGLQDEAWKLQMYAELERLRSQLEYLAPLADDAIDGPTPAGHQTLGDATSPAVQADREGGAAGVSDAPGLLEQEQSQLDQLDSEIAALDKQIVEAKKEMQSMMQMKDQLENEIGFADSQLADAAA